MDQGVLTTLGFGLGPIPKPLDTDAEGRGVSDRGFVFERSCAFLMAVVSVGRPAVKIGCCSHACEMLSPASLTQSMCARQVRFIPEVLILHYQPPITLQATEILTRG